MGVGVIVATLGGSMGVWELELLRLPNGPGVRVTAPYQSR